jgi:hypothetical protein
MARFRQLSGAFRKADRSRHSRRGLRGAPRLRPDQFNQKDVVILFKELKVSTRDGKDCLVLNRTKDELMTAPAHNNTGSRSEGRTRP